MKLYEYEGAKLFQNEGIAVPKHAVAASPEEAVARAQEIGLPVMVKAQVLTGGRYLAGGVREASSLEQVERLTRRILGMYIGDRPVEKVMIAQKVETAREFYLGITVDEYHGVPIAILSAEGGVSINQTAAERPEAVVSKPVYISRGLPPVTARRMCRDVGLRGRELTNVADILGKLWDVFRNNDALVAEINPLVKTRRGSYLALDAKVEMDNSSLFRHQELDLDRFERIQNPLERRGREIGVTYVELGGDVAVIASGAGLGMASIDIIAGKLKPANFLETGGGISEELLYNVMGLVMQKPGIRALFINVYGGINPIHEGAKGVVRYMKEHDVNIPVVAKALGNHQEETWEIFRANGVHVVDGVSTENGIELLVDVLGGGGE
jgi:succinyl-CoA synthetase beta subunit